MEIELPIEDEHPFKNQEIEQTSGVSVKAAETLWLPDDVWHQIFGNLSSYKMIRIARCVSSHWQVTFSSDAFCNFWGNKHFSPSTSNAMGMTPQEFIHYWSTPSFEIMKDNRFINGTASAMSADGSIIVGYAQDGANNNRRTAVEWINGEIRPLPLLNNGYNAEAFSFNGDGSIIVGMHRMVQMVNVLQFNGSTERSHRFLV